MSSPQPRQVAQTRLALSSAAVTLMQQVQRSQTGRGDKEHASKMLTDHQPRAGRNGRRQEQQMAYVVAKAPQGVSEGEQLLHA